MAKNFTKLFAESGLATIKSALQNANSMLQSFSLNDMGKACDEIQERLTSEFKRFKGQIFNFLDKHTIEVPFDKTTERLSYDISQDVFTVTVNSRDGSSHLSNHIFNMPENVDFAEMTQTYDSERKVMIFKFGKKN